MTRVRLDLNNPEFQAQRFILERQERNELFGMLKKLHAMTWEQVYGDRGLRWERLLSRRGTYGEELYTIRITEKFRAVARRDGDSMWLLTLHPDQQVKLTATPQRIVRRPPLDRPARPRYNDSCRDVPR